MIRDFTILVVVLESLLQFRLWNKSSQSVVKVREREREREREFGPMSNGEKKEKSPENKYAKLASGVEEKNIFLTLVLNVLTIIVPFGGKDGIL